MLLTLHHIVSDGWSMGVLIRELGALYEAHVAGQPSPLPELPVQYADFAAWQRSWLTGEVLEAQLAYWRSSSPGLPPVLELPTDRPRPAVPSVRGQTALAGRLPARWSEPCRVARPAEGATLFMTLLAALPRAAAPLHGQEDLVVGTPSRAATGRRPRA